MKTLMKQFINTCKFKVELDLLTDPNMLLMVEKGIRGRICHIIFIDIPMLIANTCKIIIKIKNHHFSNIEM